MRCCFSFGIFSSVAGKGTVSGWIWDLDSLGATAAVVLLVHQVTLVYAVKAVSRPNLGEVMIDDAQVLAGSFGEEEPIDLLTNVAHVASTSGDSVLPRGRDGNQESSN